MVKEFIKSAVRFFDALIKEQHTKTTLIVNMFRHAAGVVEDLSYNRDPDMNIKNLIATAMAIKATLILESECVTSAKVKKSSVSTRK
jgi:hypothetical protein